MRIPSNHCPRTLGRYTEFNATDFITRLGHSLIDEFKEARQATTSQLIGEAIETPVRRRLEQVLPRGIAVGFRLCDRQLWEL